MQPLRVRYRYVVVPRLGPVLAADLIDHVAELFALSTDQSTVSMLPITLTCAANIVFITRVTDLYSVSCNGRALTRNQNVNVRSYFAISFPPASFSLIYLQTQKKTLVPQFLWKNEMVILSRVHSVKDYHIPCKCVHIFGIGNQYLMKYLREMSRLEKRVAAIPRMNSATTLSLITYKNPFFI